MLDKIKTSKFKILIVVLGVFVFGGAIFGAYKPGRIQPQPPSEQEGKTFCKDPRPEVCTMECIINPPYICGSDGKSYCSECQACANPEVEWYMIQDIPCGRK